MGIKYPLNVIHALYTLNALKNKKETQRSILLHHFVRRGYEFLQMLSILPKVAEAEDLLCVIPEGPFYCENSKSANSFLPI